MITSKRRISLTLATIATVATMILSPLSALAAPNGLFYRGECGISGQNVFTNIIHESNSQNAIFDHKVVQATVVGPDKNELTAGLVTIVKGLKPVSQAGSGWQNLQVRADTGTTPIQDVFAVLHFNNGAKRVLQFNQMGQTSSTPGWRTFSVNNRDLGGFGRNLLLTKLVLVVHVISANETRSVKFGKVSIFHFNQGNIDPEYLFPNIIKSTCNETTQES